MGKTLKLCECGCGEFTRLADRTDTRWGCVKGQPRRFIRGHSGGGAKPKNMVVGQVFGNWTVIGAGPNRSHHTTWLCKCLCGTERIRIASNMTGRAKNRGCGCVSVQGHRPIESIYNLLKCAAKGRAKVSLTYEQFLEFTKQPDCHYCGKALNWKPHSSSNGYKLDRKDNSLGYSKDNCVVCCPRCNRSKSDHFTYEEWREVGQVIRSWSKP